MSDEWLGFQDLKCWQLARRLMVESHKIAGQLPAIERYDLVSQMRRSSKSVMANIAEGYGRYHYLDKLRFFYFARGSLDETVNHIITCLDLQYTSEVRFRELHDLAQEAHRALNGYIGYIRKQRQGMEEFGKSVLREPYEVDTVVSEEPVDEQMKNS
jgi:four helix bundle protein